MSCLVNDNIINIYKYCDFKHLHEIIFVNRKWFNMYKLYKQTISKLILENHGYINFKKHTDYYQLLKEFYIYDSTLDKNIIKCYIDKKYALCKFIINNLDLDTSSLTKYLDYDINLMTDSIRDYIFIKNKKGDEYLLKNLIIWKMHIFSNIYLNNDLSETHIPNRYNHYDEKEYLFIKSPLIFYNMQNIRMNLIYMFNDLNII